jgi:hypothetical protein
VILLVAVGSGKVGHERPNCVERDHSVR